MKSICLCVMLSASLGCSGDVFTGFDSGFFETRPDSGDADPPGDGAAVEAASDGASSDGDGGSSSDGGALDSGIDAACLEKADQACTSVLGEYCSRLATCCQGTCAPWANDGGAECVTKMGSLNGLYDCPKYASDVVCYAKSSSCYQDTQNASCTAIKMIDPSAVSGACQSFYQGL